MNEAPCEIVTKLQCAERQLRMAIRLFFESRDLIAVHTLSAAAQEIVTQLAKPLGLKGLYRHIDEEIRPEKRKELIGILRMAQNFFKHAGKDRGEELKFYYESTKFQLIDAVMLCSSLRGLPLPPEFAIFIAWFIGKYPHMWTDSGDGIITAVKQQTKLLNLDDFDLIASVIDSVVRDTPNSPK